MKKSFRKNIKTSNGNWDEELQYNINREVAKTSVISRGKIDKYEYLTGEEKLPSDQRGVIEQAKFVYSPLGKVLEKQTKAIEDQGEKQVNACEKHEEQLIMSSREKYSL